jgi:enoyl-CoA hydratase/carnithine racemase
MSEFVKVAVANGVGEVVLARPGGNAIDLEIYQALGEQFVQLGGRDDVSVILLRGQGSDFSIGEDMDYLAALYRGWIAPLWHNPKLVVAAVQGRALGIGCELALLADVTFAGSGARFGHPETAKGIVTHTVWPWLVGPKVAKEYLATGRLMTADQAHHFGLINAALPDDLLAEHVLRFVADIATMPKGTPGANKKRINWAFRDVSRALFDDRFYDVDFDWLVEMRAVDASFYQSVAKSDVRTAVRKRDAAFGGG